MAADYYGTMVGRFAEPLFSSLHSGYHLLSNGAGSFPLEPQFLCLHNETVTGPASEVEDQCVTRRAQRPGETAWNRMDQLWHHGAVESYLSSLVKWASHWEDPGGARSE